MGVAFCVGLELCAGIGVPAGVAASNFCIDEVGIAVANARLVALDVDEALSGVLDIVGSLLLPMPPPHAESRATVPNHMVRTTGRE